MASGGWVTRTGIVFTDVLSEGQASLGTANAPKYHNRRTWSNLCKREFASKAECKRGEYLRMLELAGEITHLEYQPRWVLSVKPKVTYAADFRYVQHGPELDDAWDVVEDVKGVLTEASRVRIAWLKAKYGIDVAIINEGRDPIDAP